MLPKIVASRSYSLYIWYVIIYKNLVEFEVWVPYGVICPFWARNGISLKKVTTCEQLMNNNLPVIFAHGKADDVAPYGMSVTNYNCCNGWKRLLLSENAEHGMSFLMSAEEYCRYISQLFSVCEDK